MWHRAIGSSSLALSLSAQDTAVTAILMVEDPDAAQLAREARRTAAPEAAAALDRVLERLRARPAAP
jgi:hypothetical protein